MHSAPGQEMKVECFVNSYPDAKVHWFFNGMPVRKTNIVTMQESDMVSAFRIGAEKHLNIFTITSFIILIKVSASLLLHY